MQDIISALKNALLQAEAGLEVAVSRLAKDNAERGDFKPSEVLALACVREALAMPVSPCLHKIQEPTVNQQLTTESDLLLAAITCAHEIETDKVVLHFDHKQPGHNALNQLGRRLDNARAALAATPAEGGHEK